MCVLCMQKYPVIQKTVHGLRITGKGKKSADKGVYRFFFGGGIHIYQVMWKLLQIFICTFL